jgi:hypothetical protein
MNLKRSFHKYSIKRKWYGTQFCITFCITCFPMCEKGSQHFLRSLYFMLRHTWSVLFICFCSKFTKIRQIPMNYWKNDDILS